MEDKYKFFRYALLLQWNRSKAMPKSRHLQWGVVGNVSDGQSGDPMDQRHVQNGSSHRKPR